MFQDDFVQADSVKQRVNIVMGSFDPGDVVERSIAMMYGSNKWRNQSCQERARNVRNRENLDIPDIIMSGMLDHQDSSGFPMISRVRRRGTSGNVGHLELSNGVSRIKFGREVNPHGMTHTPISIIFKWDLESWQSSAKSTVGGLLD
ncbi:hypothetical protein BD410DRAFT_809230 [Rickenella mellea]|uniref:Uncharacterized protein n=1 Tax=Rickenella mellea TaxID=50990 RepID=A0A4Y7PJP6_9AGAM|nr:hypothetical protein BD410DRAFT_809230 [Rickenella mellea]